MSKLGNIFRSSDELKEPVEISITGNVPEWLNGYFLLIGPGLFELKDCNLNHFFDGYALITKFHLHNGKVKFSKRYLESEAYNKANKYGKPVFTEFGTKAYPDPSKGFFSRAVSTLLPDVTDNCSNSLVQVNGALLATTDVHNALTVDLDTLSVGKKIDFYKSLGVHMMTSHLIRDHESGNYFTMGTALVTGLKYHIIKIPTGKGSLEDPGRLKEASIFASISSRWKTCIAFNHSFALTERYIIFIEQPLVMNGVKLLSTQVKGRSMKDCLEWLPEEKNRFYIVDKETGKINPVKYKSEEAFFMFHVINAYEENEEIIIDVICHSSPSILEETSLEQLRSDPSVVKDKPTPKRFVLPLADNYKDFNENVNLVKKKGDNLSAKRIGDIIEVSCQMLANPAMDLVSINPHYLGKKYRYFWASGVYHSGDNQCCLLKVDVDSGEVTRWKSPTDRMAGEARFVPKGLRGSCAEDDGVVLAGVTSSSPNDSSGDLVIIDASTMSHIAKASTNSFHVPYLPHGIFIPN